MPATFNESRTLAATAGSPLEFVVIDVASAQKRESLHAER